MDLVFREYREDDFSNLVEMVMGLYTKDGSKPTQMSAEKVDFTVKQLSLPSNPGEIIMFDVKGETVGYCILNRFWSNEFSGFIGYVDELYIKLDCRSKGIGEQFFRHLEQNPKNDFVAFMLETVESNQRATRFYQRLGFELHHNLMMFKRL